MSKAQTVWNCTMLGVPAVLLVANSPLESLDDPGSVIFYASSAACAMLIWTRFFFGDSRVFELERELVHPATDDCKQESALGATLLVGQAMGILALVAAIGSNLFCYALQTVLFMNLLWLLDRLHRYMKASHVLHELESAGARSDREKLAFLGQMIVRWCILNMAFLFVYFQISRTDLGIDRTWIDTMSIAGFSAADFVWTWAIYRTRNDD